MMDRNTPADRRRARALRWLRRSAAALLVLLLAAVALDRLFPLPLPKPDGGSTVVLARDGTPLRAFADSDGVWRYPATVGTVSPLYLQALLGYEDRWFYRHPGVNPYALLRGTAGALVHGRVVSGGSTLTMQVARIIEPIPHSFGGKFIQILRAFQLEAHLSNAEAQVCDRVLAAADKRFPHNPPQTKEAYYYRHLFEQFFPSRAAAETVPGGKSIACSSPAAIAWDASFAAAADPSGRAIAGGHEQALA